MSAAWELSIPTTPKMTLLALCDWVNDQGLCFPSVRSVARRTSLSIRQSKRVLHQLAEDGWIEVVANHTGGLTSRRYQINVAALNSGAIAGELETVGGDTDDTGDKLAPLPSATLGGEPSTSLRGCHSRHPNRHTTVNRTTTTTEKAFRPTMIFPPGLSEEEAVVVENLALKLGADQQQVVLDELSGYVAAGKIRVGPTNLMHKLVEKALSGEFHPCHAPRIAANRLREEKDERRRELQRHETSQRKLNHAKSPSSSRAIHEGNGSATWRKAQEPSPCPSGTGGHPW